MTHRTLSHRRLALLGLAFILTLTAGGLYGCIRSAPSTITTPQGKTAYTADQIVVRVNELENAAIAANASGGLPTASTRTVVEFAVKADQTLAATPAGWLATLTVLWTTAKAQLASVTNPAVLAAMGAVDVALGVLGGPTP